MTYVPAGNKAFAEMTRPARVAELRDFDDHHGTTFARGMSRAKLGDLMGAYKKALKHAKDDELAQLGAQLNPQTQTGRLSSAEPNEGGTPKPDSGHQILLRRAGGVFYFVRDWGCRERKLTAKESWLLSKVREARELVTPTQVAPGRAGIRSNPSKRAKSDLKQRARTLRRLGIIYVPDSMAKVLQQQPAA